jgi:hypothetical protein
VSGRAARASASAAPSAAAGAASGSSTTTVYDQKPIVPFVFAIQPATSLSTKPGQPSRISAAKSAKPRKRTTCHDHSGWAGARRSRFTPSAPAAISASTIGAPAAGPWAISARACATSAGSSRAIT